MKLFCVGLKRSVLAEEERGFTPLFDGKTLVGWEAFPSSTASAWTVKDGVIHGEGNGGSESYLGFSKEAFGDFELKLEYHFLSDEANSGVQVRSKLADKKIKERCFGFQLHGGDEMIVQFRNIRVKVPLSWSSGC